MDHRIPTPPRDRESLRPPQRILHTAENALLVGSLGAMVLLPLAEAVLRRFFQTGIPGAIDLTQHLALVIAMAGGTLAARENRLLSLSTLSAFLKGRWKQAAAIFSGATAAAVCVFLFLASLEFYGIEAGSSVGGFVPLRLFLILMPLGFGSIALRVLIHSSDRWRGRGLALLLAAGLVLAALFSPLLPEQMVAPALVVLFISAVLGMPIFSILGGAAVILFWGKGEPIAAISISQYEMVVNPMLPAVPLFTLAGFFLAEGQASQRLNRLFQALVGHLHGGPAVATVLLCAFFTSFTGASGVTILALGGLLMPILLSNGYGEKDSLGILTGAGSLGLLFPPCLPLILYAIVASNAGVHHGITISLQEMFLGGIVPGLVMVVLAAGLVIFLQPRAAVRKARFSWMEAMAAAWNAKWELLLPIVAVSALFSGLATPVEAAALTALYAFVSQALVHREFKRFKDVPRVMTECGLLVGGVLLILGVAMGLTNYLVDAQIPDQIVDWAKGSIHSPLAFLLALNLFLILVGCLMDIYSAIVVIVPLIVPVGLAFGVHPVHLGVIFLANLELGYLTPPVGMNLFMTSYRFNKPMPLIMRAVVPMLLVLILGVLLITYIPALSTALPRWLE